MGDPPDQPLPSPKAAGQGERVPAAGPPGPQQSCGHGGLYLPSLSHRCARVSRTLGGSKRAEWGSLEERSEPGGTRCLGMGTQRGKGSLQE